MLSDFDRKLMASPTTCRYPCADCAHWLPVCRWEPDAWNGDGAHPAFSVPINWRVENYTRLKDDGEEIECWRVREPLTGRKGESGMFLATVYGPFDERAKMHECATYAPNPPTPE